MSMKKSDLEKYKTKSVDTILANPRDEDEARSAIDAFAKDFKVPKRRRKPAKKEAELKGSSSPVVRKILDSSIEDYGNVNDVTFSDNASANFDWRRALKPSIKDDNIEAMKLSLLPGAQYRIAELAHESESDAIRLAAAQFILSQSGHGSVQKSQLTVDYAKMPADQLMAVIQSKLTSIQQKNPQFDPQALLQAKNIIEVEANE